jgi:hypothetical protein
MILFFNLSAFLEAIDWALSAGCFPGACYSCIFDQLDVNWMIDCTHRFPINERFSIYFRFRGDNMIVFFYLSAFYWSDWLSSLCRMFSGWMSFLHIWSSKLDDRLHNRHAHVLHLVRHTCHMTTLLVSTFHSNYFMNITYSRVNPLFLGAFNTSSPPTHRDIGSTFNWPSIKEQH